MFITQRETSISYTVEELVLNQSYFLCKRLVTFTNKIPATWPGKFLITHLIQIKVCVYMFLYDLGICCLLRNCLFYQNYRQSYYFNNYHDKYSPSSLTMHPLSVGQATMCVLFLVILSFLLSSVCQRAIN